MNRFGTQKDLANLLGCSKSYISKLCQAKDCRIVKQAGKIDLEQSAKNLIDSGFGNRSRSWLKVKQGPKKQFLKPETDYRIYTGKIPEGEDNAGEEFTTSRKMISNEIDQMLIDFETGWDQDEKGTLQVVDGLLKEFFRVVKETQLRDESVETI